MQAGHFLAFLVHATEGQALRFVPRSLSLTLLGITLRMGAWGYSARHFTQLADGAIAWLFPYSPGWF